jgi:hypothetical protein
MEENFSPQQSLQVIQAMIEKTKSNMRGNVFYFLLWGWISFAAILAQFLLKTVFHSDKHYLVWLVVIPAVVISTIHAARNKRKNRVRTYVGESMSYLWTGIGVSFFVLSLIISNTREGWFNAYPFFILFYGLGTYVSGRILKFIPLVAGGIFNWLLACIAVFVPYDYTMLLAAAAILTSYIIPGYLLRSFKPR